MRAISWMPGHGARPDWDPGASSPAGWTEADLVADVTAAAWLQTMRRHQLTEIVSAGTYAQRSADAEAGAGSGVLVQVHANAGGQGADAAHIFYWCEGPDEKGSNPAGKAAAERLAQALRNVLPWPVGVHAATAETWPRPRACLAAVHPTSVLVEVGFVDGTQGRNTLLLLAEPIGRAMADALVDWAKAEGL